MSKFGEMEARMNHISSLINKRKALSRELQIVSSKIANIDKQVDDCFSNHIRDFGQLKNLNKESLKYVQ